MNKKHLALFKKTKEGQKFIDELLGQLINEFHVVNGKIIELRFKEYPVLDLDEIEMKVKKNEKGDLEMKELVQKVKQWGIDKGLDKVGHLAQAEYTLKETAELLDAYADKNIDKINDAIGDILVTLIVGASNDDKAYRELIGMVLCETVYDIRPINQRCFERNYIDLLSSIFILKDNINTHKDVIGNLYKHCISGLIDVLAWANHSHNQTLSLQDCLQLAYNEIKDRKGHTDENGHFIKTN